MKAMIIFVKRLKKIDIFCLFLTLVTVIFIINGPYYSNTYVDWLGLFIIVMSQFIVIYSSQKNNDI